MQKTNDATGYPEFYCLSSTSDYEVYTRYFLLGVALHTIQDSFAHGRREPYWHGNIDALSDEPAEYCEAYYEGHHTREMYHQIVNSAHWPDPEHGSAKHNAVYTKAEGAAGVTDNPWNPAIPGYHCGQIRTHIGILPLSLMPHGLQVPTSL
jgi:hypothetical protein